MVENITNGHAVIVIAKWLGKDFWWGFDAILSIIALMIALSSFRYQRKELIDQKKMLIYQNKTLEVRNEILACLDYIGERMKHDGHQPRVCIDMLLNFIHCYEKVNMHNYKPLIREFVLHKYSRRMCRYFKDKYKAEITQESGEYQNYIESTIANMKWLDNKSKSIDDIISEIEHIKYSYFSEYYETPADRS